MNNATANVRGLRAGAELMNRGNPDPPVNDALSASVGSIAFG
jgi:hypothetical protein